MKPKMKPNLALSVPYFTASICFIAAVITRSMVWMVVGVICLAAASFLSYESAKKEKEFRLCRSRDLKRRQIQDHLRRPIRLIVLKIRKKNNRKS